MWSRLSAIKRKLLILREGQEVAKFDLVAKFLKQLSAGYKPQKAKTFTGEELAEFYRKEDIIKGCH